MGKIEETVNTEDWNLAITCTEIPPIRAGPGKLIVRSMAVVVTGRG